MLNHGCPGSYLLLIVWEEAEIKQLFLWEAVLVYLLEEATLHAVEAGPCSSPAGIYSVRLALGCTWSSPSTAPLQWRTGAAPALLQNGCWKVIQRSEQRVAVYSKIIHSCGVCGALELGFAQPPLLLTSRLAG